MSAMTVEASAQVVRDPGDRVVVIFWGGDAPAEAAHWLAQGYHVDTIDRELLGY